MFHHFSWQINHKWPCSKVNHIVSHYLPVIKHGVLENRPFIELFIGDVPIKPSIDRGFSS